MSESQKVALPPTLDDVIHHYSAGVLTALVAISNLTQGIPVDGVIQSVITEKDLTELLEELQLTNDFKELKNKV